MQYYQQLKVVKYNTAGNQENYLNEYKRRFNSETTYHTNLKPNLIRRGEFATAGYPIFIVNLPEITLRTEQILTSTLEIKRLTAQLPNIAVSQFLIETMGNEIVSTNEIEGVQSTRQEVDDAIVAANDSKTNARLTSTVKKYQDILKGDFLHIENLEDIRIIYDELLKGEINRADLPDGQLFRTNPVYIQGGSVDKKVLVAPTSEVEITHRLADWLMFINGHDVPFLIKALIGHYFFENTHPFYDGNGRTGRYILSMYLARKLDIFTGISFSQSVRSNREKYYKAFSDTGDADNFADGTSFVLELMEIISSRQSLIIQSLNERATQLKRAKVHIMEQYTENSPERHILYLLVQSRLFNDSDTTGIIDNEIKELGKKRGLSARSINQAFLQLTEAGIIDLIKRRPLQHVISRRYLAEIEKAPETI